MLIGHSQLVRDFKNLSKSRRLAHGYIFFGEPEVGKFYFARHLANLLEIGEWEIVTRPLQDALILENASGIDEMRKIKNFLWQKPAISEKRLVIINNAENLTSQAQNAILKITEEPPENSLIILIAAQPDILLPPLLSRMQKIYFGRLSDSEMLKVISEKRIIDIAFGRPGRAVRLINDALTKEAEDYAEEFLKVSSKRFSLIKELIALQNDLSDKEGAESKLLDYFFESLILKLRKNTVKNSDILKSVLHRLFLIKSYNTNNRLQIEAMQ